MPETGYSALLSKIIVAGPRSADFKRFGVRCKRLLEQNPAQALVGIRLDGQQKQISQKTAKITKGLGINRAPTGCGTQLGEAQ